MKFSCLIITLLGSLFVNAQSIQHTELLGRPTEKSIVVQLIFDDSAEMNVEYGTSSGTYSSQTGWKVCAPGEASEVLIAGLLPDTKYFYRTSYRKPGQTSVITRPEYTFHTQRKPGGLFSFVVQADPHMDEQTDTALYRLCLKNQLEDAPDFMIDLGDFLMTDKLRNAAKVVPRDTITYRCHLLRSYYEQLGHSVPIFIALGNHEGEAGWYLNGTKDNIAVWNTNDRKKYFLNPAPDDFYTGDTTQHPFIGQRENYYSWTWGNALFIVLDPYWYTNPKPDSLNGWRWTLGKVQYDWLKNTLEKSQATFKFVFAHQIIGGDPEGRGGVEFANRYEWGGDNLDGTKGFAANRPGWYKPIKNLLAENRVTIFFHGHDHFFGKQEKECLIYQETPQPSHPNFSNAGQASVYGYFEGQILPNSGHLRVTVDADGVKTEYIRAYLPQNETASRNNKDVSATYFIGKLNCYDSLSTGVPVIWNSNYADELVYPNPFKDETRIEFAINAPEKINIFIFNGSGQLVRALVSGSLISAGRFQVIWDGKDYSGAAVPNGIYWYMIRGDKGLKNDGKICCNRQ